MGTLKSGYGSAGFLCIPSTFRCWWEAQPKVYCVQLFRCEKSHLWNFFSHLGSAKRDLAGGSRGEVGVANTSPAWQVSLCTPWTRAQLSWASRQPRPGAR